MYGPKPRNNPSASRPAPYGPRSTVLGAGPHSVPPAWRTGSSQQRNSAAQSSSEGTKILISGLPFDVEKEAVVELLQSTVGPLEDVICVYNKDGSATGMSIAQFKRTQHAYDARRMYNGKVVDQRKPIKVEIIGEPLPASTYGAPSASRQAPAPPPPPPTLMERLGVVGNTFAQSQQKRKGPRPSVVQIQQQNALAIQQQAFVQTNSSIVALNNERRPRKKGPRRLQKARVPHVVPQKKTAAQLDAEMDDYRNSAPKPQPSSP